MWIAQYFGRRVDAIAAEIGILIKAANMLIVNCIAYATKCLECMQAGGCPDGKAEEGSGTATR